MVDQSLREGILEKRVSVASTFVSMLIALAFSEMVLPVKASNYATFRLSLFPSVNSTQLTKRNTAIMDTE